MIPKTLHFIWLDADSDTAPMPDKYVKYYQSWVDRCPDFHIEFWNGEKVKRLLRKYPQYADTFAQLQQHIEKCDFARYMILYDRGGLYSDLDFYCVRNPAPLLEGRYLMFMWEPEEHNRTGARNLFNGVIGSTPKHPFWSKWIDYMSRRYDPNNDVLNTTGPSILGKFAIEQQLPPDAFVDTCSFLSKTLPTPMDLVRTRETRCAGDQVYGYTEWTDGSFWALKDLRKNAKFIIIAFKEWIACIVCVIALAIWLYTRRRA